MHMGADPFCSRFHFLQIWYHTKKIKLGLSNYHKYMVLYGKSKVLSAKAVTDAEAKVQKIRG